MTIVQIRTPLRVKQNVINSHEQGLLWENQSNGSCTGAVKLRIYFEDINRIS